MIAVDGGAGGGGDGGGCVGGVDFNFIFCSM